MVVFVKNVFAKEEALACEYSRLSNAPAVAGVNERRPYLQAKEADLKQQNWVAI